MNASEPAVIMASEHPIATSVRLRAMRLVLWMRVLWARESGGAHPSAVQHEEVDRILADPSVLAEAKARFYATDPEAVRLGQELAEAETRLESERGWLLLADRLRLDQAECQFLAVVVALALDPALGRVFAYLHDQPEMDYATPWLAAALYEPHSVTILVDWNSALLRWGLVVRLSGIHNGFGPLSAWGADPSIAAWLIYGGDIDLPPACSLFESGGISQSQIYPDILVSMLEFAGKMEQAVADGIEIELVAPPGSGRKTLAQQFAAARGQSLVLVTEAGILRDIPEMEIPSRVMASARAARMRNAILYWGCEGAGHPSAINMLRRIVGVKVIGRLSSSVDAASQGIAFRSFELPPLSLSARLALWRSIRGGEPPRQIREWLLSPGEIIAIRKVAQAGSDAITQACRRPTESANLLVRLPLPYSKKDLVLPESLMGQLDDLEHQIRHRWVVYEEWGFDRLCRNGRGIVALFGGPSGTGKTMAAQVLARSLGLELYRLDPANVVNKYIGETEKRLKIVFDECDRANFLLLIDECEGMFGQRFSSKDAHDRYANLEIDYLLQRLERFQGVAILTTNRKNDLDHAFLRRIRMVVDFLPPGPAERRALWRAAFNADDATGQSLLDGIDWDSLTERLTLNGAEINLAALNAAFLARAEDKKIGMKHVITAVRRELAKKGQTLRGFE